MIAEFRVDDPEFPLSETLVSMGDLEVRSNFQPGTDPEGRTGFFTVFCPDFDAFERQLETDPSVVDYVELRERAGRRWYCIDFSGDVRWLAPTIVEEGLLIERLHSAGGKWEFRVFAPDREHLVDAIDRCKERCRSFSLTQLHTNETAAEADGLGLTDAQRETLCLAKREGFFHVPRGVTQDELADRLGVSTSAVSQRIRKGLDAILEDALDPE